VNKNIRLGTDVLKKNENIKIGGMPVNPVNDENEVQWFKVRVLWVNDVGKKFSTETQHKGLINVSRCLLTLKYKRGYVAEKIEIMRCENIEDYWFL